MPSCLLYLACVSLQGKKHTLPRLAYVLYTCKCFTGMTGQILRFFLQPEFAPPKKETIQSNEVRVAGAEPLAGITVEGTYQQQFSAAT